MSLTVGEVKLNAEHNLASRSSIATFQHMIGQEQLDNYNKAIELGANDNDDWYDWQEEVEASK